MQIPNRPYRLTRVLHVQPTRVDVRVWQAHVLKHPFGLGALYNLAPLDGNRRWNAEGWDETEPPTITSEDRARLVRQIVALESEGHRCSATRIEREEYRGEAPYAEMPCYECRPALASSCASVTSTIGERYAAALTDALEALEDAVEVSRNELSVRVMKSRAELDPSIVVLSVGRLANRDHGARISVASGVRIELYREGGTLTWRTTYRARFQRANDRANHLNDVLPPVPGAPLSGRVLVVRRWWESGL